MTNFFKVFGQQSHNLESDLDAIYISCRLLVGNSCPKPGSVSLFSLVFYSVMSYFCWPENETTELTIVQKDQSPEKNSKDKVVVK